MQNIKIKGLSPVYPVKVNTEVKAGRRCSFIRKGGL